ncbi:MAG: type II toxin-antitoxin system VapC family toxin [Campylobacterota bacterium]|nr:type II toxin-antitoxin system VapC family toxin [Campylobacterota bacterium]
MRSTTMSKRLFLDTNIVADFIDSDRPYHQSSVTWYQEMMLQNVEFCISEDMITTLYYISKDKEATLVFLQNVIFVDWQILTFGQEVHSEAVQISLDKKEDLEDILQCLCAKAKGCDTIITNDKNFYDCSIEIKGTVS